jgi:hypothetical protein
MGTVTEVRHLARARLINDSESQGRVRFKQGEHDDSTKNSFD